MKRKSEKKNVFQPPSKIPKHNADESQESDTGEDMLEMIDQDDLSFIKQAISNRSYHIFDKVKYTGPKLKKPQHDNNKTIESQYEDRHEDEEEVQFKNLLPIKTKKGVIPQRIVAEKDLEKNDDNDEENDANIDKIEGDDDDDEEEKEEEFTFEDSKVDLSKPISTAQLLALRNETLRQYKIQIGSISSTILENPEEKVGNLKTLLNLMDEEVPEIYITIRKLVIISLLEVFKDILPSYQIKGNVNEGVKLKKDTLKLNKFEETLLQYYKKYLKTLEKYCFILKKKGNFKQKSEEEIKLGELAIQAMCDLLVSHPYFNFAQNIAQVIVPFMSCSNKNVRGIVKTAVKTVFKQDKKEEISLHILRIINQFLKNHAHNVHTEMLEALLVLNLTEVNLDQTKEDDLKQKKLNAKKQKILQMSKKEKKRKKRLQQLEKELLETKAEENKQTKHKNMTEMTKIIFNIYFRILKNSSNSKILGICLEGLAKFAHCINLEYYVDLVNILDHLLKEEWLGYREQLHCIQTVFAIISGYGEALTLDPTRFYTSLYKDLLKTHASRNHDNCSILLKILNEALIKRRKKITNKRLLGFVKRLCTLSLQLLHNGSLGCLGLIKSIMQLNKAVDILLDLDSSVGDGCFYADVDDPEYANASTTALYELNLLEKHYHPVVNKYAKNIANGIPTTGKDTLPLEYGKLTYEQLYQEFSMAEMAFNPPVPVPKKIAPKSKPQRINFVDDSFKKECQSMLRKQQRLGRLCTV